MAINFPSPVINGNTYDYNGVRYTYTKSGVDEGYWRVTTPGSVGIATSNEISAGTDGVKYVTPLGLVGTAEWDLLVDAATTAVANTLAVRTATGNLVAAPATANGHAVTYEQLLGVGQTWQDMSGSRVEATNYTNDTGRPIMVNIVVNPNTSPSNFLVDGVVVAISLGVNTSTERHSMSALVPNGSVYQLVNDADGVFAWAELR